MGGGCGVEGGRFAGRGGMVVGVERVVRTGWIESSDFLDFLEIVRGGALEGVIEERICVCIGSVVIY